MPGGGRGAWSSTLALCQVIAWVGPVSVAKQLQLQNARLALHALDLRRADRRIAHPAAAPRSVLFDKNLWGISERAVHEQSDRRCGGWGGWRVKLARLDQRGGHM